MVAVRTRTAGQPALRRSIIIEQPGICMPGAAACALQRSACAATATLPVPLSQRPFALPLPPAAPFSLPSFLPAFLRLTASHFATGVMSLASVHGARLCSRAAIAVAHRAEASSTPVSGMDIADRNAVAAVRRTASHRRFRLRRGVCGTGRGLGQSIRVVAYCLTGWHMSYNAPAACCARVIHLQQIHRGGGLREKSPSVDQTMLAKKAVSTQNRQHGREQ